MNILSRPVTSERFYCERCGKKLSQTSFYKYKNGERCEICKPCLTAHIDNFDPETYIWVLQKMDVPYIPAEWNNIRDKAFNKDPYKMNGMTVIGKYLAKMRLRQWKNYTFADTERIQKEKEQEEQKQRQILQKERKEQDEELKMKYDNGQISLAEYQTLASVQSQRQQMQFDIRDSITGQKQSIKAESYEDALKEIENTNPFLEQNFISQEQLFQDLDKLDKNDILYLGLKWGRTYKPHQWLTLEKLYNQFMSSFDIQGAARIDTLKMICKTSLKMNQAIDIGDIQSYQKLSRVYDAMMKSARFTEAQNKEKEGEYIDSASAIVDFVEGKSGAIPRYECKESQDLIDQIIIDLKAYNKSLIYEDKSLAQQIEKYLQDRRNSEAMKKDKQDAKRMGLDQFEQSDQDYVDYKESLRKMKDHDSSLDDNQIEEQYKKRRINLK